MSISQTQIDAIIVMADESFWETITASLPQATTGDLSPEMTIKLELAMKEALAEWIKFNVPEKNNKTVEILLHDVEYFYHDGDFDITEGDKEHIAYMISQGFREGELATSCPEDSDEVYHDWWSIKK